MNELEWVAAIMEEGALSVFDPFGEAISPPAQEWVVGDLLAVHLGRCTWAENTRPVIGSVVEMSDHKGGHLFRRG